MDLLPAWKNETEYQGLTTADFEADVDAVRSLIAQIEELNKVLTESAEEAAIQGASDDREILIQALQKISRLGWQAFALVHNLNAFVSCELSVDAKNAVAQKLQSRIQEVVSTLNACLKARTLLLSRCEEVLLQEYLGSDSTANESFYWRERRREKDLLLSHAEETTLQQFRQFGLTAWGDLYNQISGSLRVHIPAKGEVGLSEAVGFLRGSDAKLREEAWHGIQAAWKLYEEPCAAILNNLAGFRLAEYKKRSHTRQIDFLEMPVRQARIERQTLDAMMSAVRECQQISQRGLHAMAKVFGKKQLDPWDLMAPLPQNGQSNKFSFEKAMHVIAESFHQFSPEMGDFIGLMQKNQWIEARILPNKRQGAYCTVFPKSRTPRVFQSFSGSLNEVSTLAHELGHAYHSWVIRDLPLVLSEYPMTLAETASIFGETLLADQMFAKGDSQTQFAVAWGEVSHAVGLLANVSARFDFEKDFYQKRETGILTANELGDLTEKAFRKWYGEGLSLTERQFWMTKLHFSISGVSFYNFPYIFGYLFSLGLYARCDQDPNFAKTYVAILRDTGRMTAEELLQKHLGVDIRKSNFWLESLRIVEKKVARLEALAQ